jgi:SAM-dependent methyltransferase
MSWASSPGGWATVKDKEVRALTNFPVACPHCHHRLVQSQSAGGLVCCGCATAFPRRAEVEVFLSESAWQEVVRRVEQEYEANTLYRRARRQSPLNVQYYDDWVRRLWSLVPQQLRFFVLELMCGEAECGRRLPRDLGVYLGIDLNVRLVEEAARFLRQEEDPRFQVVCGSADQLPLPDASVGAILIQGGLHHARPFLSRILAEAARVLVPNGVLVASEPANDAWLIRTLRHWQYRHSKLQGHDPDEDGFTRNEIGTALAEHGLRLDTYRPFGYVAYPLMGNTDLLPLLARRRSRFLGQALLALDRCLESCPGLRRLSWASLFRASKMGADVALNAVRRAG